jgi:hypothetical protein
MANEIMVVENDNPTAVNNDVAIPATDDEIVGNRGDEGILTARALIKEDDEDEDEILSDEEDDDVRKMKCNLNTLIEFVYCIMNN